MTRLESYIAVVRVDNMEDSIVDMDEFAQDLGSDLDRMVEAQDCFACMDTELITAHDWDEETGKIIVHDSYLTFLITMQVEEDMMPEEGHNNLKDILLDAFGKIMGYYDEFILLHRLCVSREAVGYMKEGWE